MKKFRKGIAIFIAVMMLLFVAVLAACPAMDIQVTSITVSPNPAIVEEGSTVQLTATVEPANATDSTVTWASADATVATVNASTGLVTAVGAAGESTTVTATAGGRSSSTVVTIVEEGAVLPTSVTISPSTASVRAGSTTTLSATVYPAEASQAVTWTTSNAGIATVAGGVVTGVAEGEATITAMAVNGEQGTATITVLPAEAVTPVTRINVTGATTIVRGAAVAARTLTAEVLPENATDTRVTWTSSDPTMATVTNTGLVNPVATGTDGEVIITATSVSAPDVSGSLTVTIASPAVTGVRILGEVVREIQEAAIGTPFNVQAAVDPVQAANRLVSWHSSNQNVATVTENATTGAGVTLTNNTQVMPVGLGSTVITATSLANGEFTDSINVTVTESQWTKISTVEDFLEIEAILERTTEMNFYLANDIDFGGLDIAPISGATMTRDPRAVTNALQGVFDGQGYTLRNFTLAVTSGYCNGLFARVYGGVIRNLNIEGMTATNTGTHAGGFPGLLVGSGLVTIENVSIQAEQNWSSGGWWTMPSTLIGVAMTGSIIRNVVLDVSIGRSHETTSSDLTPLRFDDDGEITPDGVGSSGVVLSALNYTQAPWENIFIVTDGLHPIRYGTPAITQSDITVASNQPLLFGHFGHTQGGYQAWAESEDIPTAIDGVRENIQLFERAEMGVVNFDALDTAIWDLSGGFPTVRSTPLDTNVTISIPTNGFYITSPLRTRQDIDFAFSVAVLPSAAGTPSVDISIDGGVPITLQGERVGTSQRFNFVLPYAQHGADPISIVAVNGLATASVIVFSTAARAGIQFRTSVEDATMPSALSDASAGFTIVARVLGTHYLSGSLEFTFTVDGGTPGTRTGERIGETHDFNIVFTAADSIPQNGSVVEITAVSGLTAFGAVREISTPQQFVDIFRDSHTLAASYVLTQDIDFTGFNAEPGQRGRWVTHTALLGGNTIWQNVTFTGSFDGQGYAIRNIHITSGYAINAGGHAGLFPVIGAAAVVENLAIIDFTTHDGPAGQSGVLARAINGTVRNIYLEGTVSYGFIDWGEWGNNGVIAAAMGSNAVVENVVANVVRESDASFSIALTLGGATLTNVFVVYSGITAGAYGMGTPATGSSYFTGQDAGDMVFTVLPGSHWDLSGQIPALRLA